MVFTCPRCGTSRPTSESPCPGAGCGWQPRIGPPAPPPRREPSAHELRQYARVVVIIVCGVLLSAERLVTWLNKGDFGESCEGNSKCHSDLCVPSADPEEVARLRKQYREALDVWEERMAEAKTEEVRAAIEEDDKPKPPWVSPVYPGTCSVSCEEEECPPGWSCGTVRETHGRYGWDDDVKKVCFAPDDPMLSGTGE